MTDMDSSTPDDLMTIGTTLDNQEETDTIIKLNEMIVQNPWKLIMLLMKQIFKLHLRNEFTYSRVDYRERKNTLFD